MNSKIQVVLIITIFLFLIIIFIISSIINIYKYLSFFNNKTTTQLSINSAIHIF